MELNKIVCCDVLEGLRGLPDKSINSVITSPPYWQLRDYGWDGQWGLEPTFQQYLEHLWEMMDEIYRVLKDDGTAWINLGDTYGSFRGKSGRAPDSMEREKGLTESNKYVRDMPNKDSFEKCLLMIPHRFAIGCMERNGNEGFGINRNWKVRNDIIWAKRNGMPESVTDRFTKKHEFIFFMVKNENYYFDLDGIRDKHKQVSIDRAMRGISENNKWINGADGQSPHNLSKPRKNTRGTQKWSLNSAIDNPQQDSPVGANENGKNPGDISDFWDVPTQGTSDDHYASFNTKLIDKPIIAGCPKDGIILDPFCGTATTGLRAIELGRKFIGFDGSEKYVNAANKKLQYLLSQTVLF